MNARAILIMFSLLFACGNSNKEEATDAGDAGGDVLIARPHDELDNGEGWVDPCARPTVQTFKVDGSTWVVTVPTLCDPNPYIEKGDPPWEKRNTPSNEK